MAGRVHGMAEIRLQRQVAADLHYIGVRFEIRQGLGVTS